jgi:excisionase family DNA binding protein
MRQSSLKPNSRSQPSIGRCSSFPLLPVLERIASCLERIDQKLSEERPADEPIVEVPVCHTGPNPNAWLSVRQCASFSGISETTLRRAIHSGALRSHLVGLGKRRPTYRIKESDLVAFLNGNVAEAKTPPAMPTARVRKKSRHFD